MTRTLAPTCLLKAAAPVLGLACLVWAGDGLKDRWLINESASLPRGLYVRDDAAGFGPGAIVAFTPDAEARAYLATLGAPRDMRLLKRVAALPGAEACWTPAGLRLSGRLLRTRPHDRRGVRLPRWRACGRLEGADHVVLGDTAGSFDSRYFGPVHRARLKGPYRRILTW